MKWVTAGAPWQALCCLPLDMGGGRGARSDLWHVRSMQGSADCARQWATRHVLRPGTGGQGASNLPSAKATQEVPSQSRPEITSRVLRRQGKYVDGSLVYKQSEVRDQAENCDDLHCDLEQIGRSLLVQHMKPGVRAQRLPKTGRWNTGCAPSMGSNSWGASPLWVYRLGLIVSKDNHEPKARARPRGLARRKPECQRCEATDCKPHRQGRGPRWPSWHMTAKPTGTQPKTNAALVHRQFALLPAETCGASGAY